MKSETIADIVREIREKNPCEEYPAEYGHGEVPNEMRKLAFRIEAAANAEREVSRTWCEKCEAGVYKAENARLRAALKPVLEVDFDHGNIDGETLFGQIRECQDIYNASEVKV